MGFMLYVLTEDVLRPVGLLLVSIIIIWKVFENIFKCKYSSFEKFKCKCKYFSKVFKMHLNANAFAFDPISELWMSLFFVNAWYFYSK